MEKVDDVGVLGVLGDMGIGEDCGVCLRESIAFGDGGGSIAIVYDFDAVNGWFYAGEKCVPGVRIVRSKLYTKL